MGCIVLPILQKTFTNCKVLIKLHPCVIFEKKTQRWFFINLMKH